MATLTDNEVRAYELGKRNSFPVIASDIIFEGAAVGLNSAGNARPLVAGDEFGGFAQEKADNSAGAAGDKRVRTIEDGKIELTVAGVDATKTGEAVYATDDNTFTLTKAANSVRIGHVHRFTTTGKCIVAFKATSLQTGIADPSGGATVDAESRTAIGSIIDALEARGIVLPV